MPWTSLTPPPVERDSTADGAAHGRQLPYKTPGSFPFSAKAHRKSSPILRHCRSGAGLTLSFAPGQIGAPSYSPHSAPAHRRASTHFEESSYNWTRLLLLGSVRPFDARSIFWARPFRTQHSPGIFLCSNLCASRNAPIESPPLSMNPPTSRITHPEKFPCFSPSKK